MINTDNQQFIDIQSQINECNDKLEKLYEEREKMKENITLFPSPYWQVTNGEGETTFIHVKDWEFHENGNIDFVKGEILSIEDAYCDFSGTFWMYNLNDCKVKYITKEEWENNCIEAFTKLIKK